MPHLMRLKSPIFQSTLSVRRATALVSESDAERFISIHALRKESDVGFGWVDYNQPNFNPRSP